MSSSEHIDNKGKDILSLGEGTVQALDDITLTMKAKYSVNLSSQTENFVPVCIIMGATVFFNDYRSIITLISKHEATNLMQNSGLTEKSGAI